MDLNRLKNNLRKVNINKLISEIINTDEFKDIALEYVRYRLLNSGKDIDGNFIQTDSAIDENNGLPYSSYTINYKNSVGDNVKNVTFRDTGDFYKTLEFKEIGSGEYQIIGDLYKKGKKGKYVSILNNFLSSYKNNAEFMQKILFLTKENKSDLAKDIYELCATAINEILVK